MALAAGWTAVSSCRWVQVPPARTKMWAAVPGAPIRAVVPSPLNATGAEAVEGRGMDGGEFLLLGPGGPARVKITPRPQRSGPWPSQRMHPSGQYSRRRSAPARGRKPPPESWTAGISVCSCQVLLARMYTYTASSSLSPPTEIRRWSRRCSAPPRSRRCRRPRRGDWVVAAGGGGEGGWGRSGHACRPCTPQVPRQRSPQPGGQRRGRQPAAGGTQRGIRAAGRGEPRVHRRGQHQHQQERHQYQHAQGRKRRTGQS